jgi:WS/DGAT/MGAT family acyltransferase
MGDKAYEKLSAQDSSFLRFEGLGARVHVTAVAVFDAGQRGAGAGRLDVEQMRAYIGSRLHLTPRYRQRLAFTPVQRHPIWVDDAGFDLSYHVRHAALPQPGSDAQLKEFVGGITSQPLDLDRPAWEIWLVEGLSGGRSAAVAKIHHSLVDGVSGMGLLTSLLSPVADDTIAPPPPWNPKPHPGTLEFLADGARGSAQFSASTVRDLGSLVWNPRRTAANVAEGATAIWETLTSALTRPGSTPFNASAGVQRRVEWCALDLALVRDLRKRLDGSINDVVLTIVTGMVRRLLRKRRVRIKGLDFRVTVPVNMRSGPQDADRANKVSAWFLSLPVAEPDASRRFERVREQTRRCKELQAAEGFDLLWRLADWSGSPRLGNWLADLASLVQPYNLIVTNIHGPDVPLYMLGARLSGVYPTLPLFANQGLAVAALSYQDRVCLGFTGDRDLMPDLAEMPAHVEAAVHELRSAAECSGRR